MYQPPPFLCVSRQVTISNGDEPSRQKCAELIRAKMAEYAQLVATGQLVPQSSGGGGGGLASMGGEKFHVDIPNDNTVNFVIGQKGATIRQLSQ